MPEELEKGEEVTGAADQDTGGDTPAAGDQDEKMVPLASLEDERAKRQEAESALQRERDYQSQMMSIQQANQPQQQVQKPPDPLADIDDEDVVLGKDMKTILKKVVSGMMQGVQHQNFSIQHPDYSQIVGTQSPDGRFIPAGPMKHLLERKPELYQYFMNTPNAHIFAYEMAKAEKDLMENEGRISAEKEKAAQQAVEQKTGPMSPAAAGGGGAIDQAAQFSADVSSWTPEEQEAFEKKSRAVKAGKYDNT